MSGENTRKHAQSPAAAVWLREVWEVAAQDDHLRSLALRVALTPDKRVGVFHVRTQAVHVVDGRAVAVVCQVDGYYPNAHRQSLEAFFLGEATRLAARLDELAKTQAAGGL